MVEPFGTSRRRACGLESKALARRHATDNRRRGRSTLSQGRDGRWWRSLVLPILDQESGLYRADFLSSHLSEELVGADRGGAPFSLLLLEGETIFGRRLTSSSVSAVARALVCTARQEDLPARLGPRTFALLLPQVEEAAATRIARVLELDLRIATAGSGDRWRVSCLSYPAHRERLERITLEVEGRRAPSEHRIRCKSAA